MAQTERSIQRRQTRQLKLQLELLQRKEMLATMTESHTTAMGADGWSDASEKSLKLSEWERVNSSKMSYSLCSSFQRNCRLRLFLLLFCAIFPADVRSPWSPRESNFFLLTSFYTIGNGRIWIYKNLSLCFCYFLQACTVSRFQRHV